MDLLIAAISWDPGFRGFLTVVLGACILAGSVYLILATNSGPRLGFLLTLTALAGWMTIMGLVWSMYGIGYQGRVAEWKIEEIVYGDLDASGTDGVEAIPDRSDMPSAEEIRALIDGNDALLAQFPDDPTRRAPQVGDLISVDPAVAEDPLIASLLDVDGWHLLGSADGQTGEAVASASAYLTEERALFESSSDFVVLDAWSRGGKDSRSDDSLLGRAAFKVKRIVTWPLGHPTHHAVVRVQAVVPTESVDGAPPPTPVADETQPVVSVVMVRDLGTRRGPAFFTMAASAVVFAICCNSLHRRDKLVAAARAAEG